MMAVGHFSPVADATQPDHCVIPSNSISMVGWGCAHKSRPWTSSRPLPPVQTGDPLGGHINNANDCSLLTTAVYLSFLFSVIASSPIKLARPPHKPLLSYSIPSFAHRAFRGRLRSSPDALLEPDSGGGSSSPAEHAGCSASTGATNPPPPQLAVELLERIADFLFELKPPTTDSTGDASLCCTKPSWKEVSGFMEANIGLHRLGFVRWLRVITIKEPDDWTVVSQNLHIIREVKCLDRVFLDPRNQRILSQFPYLYSATIDAHSDVWHDDNNRFAYRDIIAALPPLLKRLEITHAHGPDVKVIATVKKYCPKIEELRLGRCTMFNRMPACDFWASFPHDHDAYISDAGIDSYAHALGHELSPLKNLRSLRMGLYLVPSSTVLSHRLYHRRGRTAPESIDWRTAIPASEMPTNPFTAQPEHVDFATIDQLVSVLHQQDSDPDAAFDCPQCVETTTEITKVAETSASAILHSHVPSLTKVQWMGWLTPDHLGFHSFELPLDLVL